MESSLLDTLLSNLAVLGMKFGDHLGELVMKLLFL